MFRACSRSLRVRWPSRSPSRLLQCQSCRLKFTAVSDVEYRPIETLLIANRGEIACRIVRTAKKMGIRTVAVYSDADEHSLHVKMADEAYHIGAAASAESYLRHDKILHVAQTSGADAIHPGYGFLSENAEFAEQCQEQSVIFVGPPASAIRDMGIKNRAKQIMSDAGVPVVHGYHGSEQSDQKLREECDRIGYPVMLKAVRGGGGKGMRIAMTPNEFESQLTSARREAKKSFGNDDMLVEKFVVRPRHVEVQVFGDQHDNYVYLWERDCSVQRRHQKIIEEAPAPGLTPQNRHYLGEAAVKAARAVNYVGAGTVEFILDPEHNFYFMEMNTRLQVEHPVSEMITGTDLVEWQLRVAAGETLPIVRQEGIPFNGHAVECRLYAEDTRNGFMPAAGHLHYLKLAAGTKFPSSTPWLRVETGVGSDDTVSVHYDPMVAKLVVWAPDRQQAIRRMDRTLAQTAVVGLETNVDFLRAILNNDDFATGDVYTDFIPDREQQLFEHTFAHSIRPAELPVLGAAAVATFAKRAFDVQRQHVKHHDANDPFSRLTGFRVNVPLTQTLQLQESRTSAEDFSVELVAREVSVTDERDGSYTVASDAEQMRLRVQLQQQDAAPSGGSTVFRVSVVADGLQQQLVVVFADDQLVVLGRDGARSTFQLPKPKWQALVQGGLAAGSAGATAPMPGVIESVLVQPGQDVQAGDPLVVMVAMKMEYVIKAHRPGRVAQVNCAVGDNVGKDAQLVILEEEDDQQQQAAQA